MEIMQIKSCHAMPCHAGMPMAAIGIAIIMHCHHHAIIMPLWMQ
jgi:hypothetical protein